ncbi:hypothetical protein GOODEAATRI_023904 [Goodea atripinnis]|uniref:Uncharacterized protein n=1 Tax=Goodea atripinnis TaxID=208336 RepID=A0ABV0Q0J2_9TELE
MRRSELWRQQWCRCYLETSGMSLLNQRPTATSILSTNVTPISRNTLLTRNPEASNINLGRQSRAVTSITAKVYHLVLVAATAEPDSGPRQPIQRTSPQPPSEHRFYFEVSE